MSVSLSKQGININGKNEIILCGSLFYFRIPKDEWEDRITKLKYAGYNALDVYFPWNYHENIEGEFDFTGNKDIETFLQIAAKHNMYVVARPGPYICSEFDLGGLPPYLLTKEGLILRDNNEIYLSYVKRYFDTILPILSKYQLGLNGTIIILQIENELDFYKRVCKDQYGYIKALYDMTLPYNFTVPVIACAGEGDEKNATGLFEKITPTFNFYPFSNSLKFEEISTSKAVELYKRDIPLMITETNRATSQLKRLLSSGVKLLGPYNQVSGNDFGFSNAVNNWGNPLTYLTSDYDFGGLIRPHGSFSKDIYESKLLGKFITTYGENLASGFLEKEVVNYTVGEKEYQLNHTFKMLDDTVIYTVSTFKSDGKLHIKYGDLKLPQKANIHLYPYKNTYFMHNVSLTQFEVDLVIDYALFEINQIFRDGSDLYLISLYEEETEMMINNEVIVLHEEPYEIKVDNTRVIVKHLPRNKAALLKNIIGGQFIYEKDLHKEDTFDGLINEFSISEVSSNYDMKYARDEYDITWLEDRGLYNGIGMYHLSDSKGGIGMYFEQVSDIVSVYKNGNAILSTIAANTPILIENRLKEYDTLEVKTEIWGHTNFHDGRLPSLHMASKRGLTGAYLLLSKVILNLDKNLKINNKHVLHIDGNLEGKIVINGDIYIIDSFRKQINLSKYIGHKVKFNVLSENNEPYTPYLFEIEEMYIKELSLINEHKIIEFVTTKSYSEVNKFPFKGTFGNQYVMKFDVTNKKQINKYLLIEAKGLKITVIFDNKVINRLFFNENSLVKMTGGGKNRVYLPRTWFKGTIGEVVMLVEVLHQVNEITKLDVYNVNT